ncbi:hypothetical protein LWE61_16380 [Sphingobium sufflavum]|nr:hypothetical protein [Sphingobium sufflavum]
MRTVSFDPHSGVVTTICTGASQPEEQAAYIADLHAAMIRSRQKNGRVMHLVDHRNGVIQTQFGGERLARRESPRQACDRTAILVKPGYSNLSLSRGSSMGEIRFFSDHQEALAWLSAAVLKPLPAVMSA